MKWLTHLDDYDFDDPTDIPKFSDQSWTVLNLPSLLKDSLATLRGSSLATSLSANLPTQPLMLSTPVSSLEAKTLPEAAAESSAGLVQKWHLRYFHRGFTRLQPPKRKIKNVGKFNNYEPSLNSMNYVVLIFTYL